MKQPQAFLFLHYASQIKIDMKILSQLTIPKQMDKFL